MNQFRTQAIILNRTNYGEADRIISFLTPDHGKVKAIAKGVRKTKSKLAGGIELFSTSDISFIPGKREISTVVSTRLIKHYGHIVKDLDHINAAYALIKRLDRATEDEPEAAYFYLLEASFEALNDPKINLGLINTWFNMQLLRLSGHTPNLRTDTNDQKLLLDKNYSFDFERMYFLPDEQGIFTADHIKFLRLGFSPNSPHTLSRVKRVSELIDSIQPLVQAVLQAFVRT